MTLRGIAAMKKALMMGSVLLLLITPWVVGAPVIPFGEKTGFRQLELAPFGRETYPIRCKAKESTRVMVWGQGKSPLAVYVFDVHGNCVAHDDLSLSRDSDALALEWYSPAQADYDVEVHNLGRRSNTSEIAIR